LLAINTPAPPLGVVLIEDEPRMRALVAKHLNRLGYTVTVFADGPAALAGLAEDDTDFDLLLTDVVLPGGMNGRQVADALSRTHPDMHVLFVSGYNHESMVAQGVLDADAKFLSKPFRKPALEEKIHEALEAAPYRPRN
jgi:CheY-like chemotaxis protein